MRPWCLHRARMMLSVKVKFACLITTISAAMAKLDRKVHVNLINVWMHFED